MINYEQDIKSKDKEVHYSSDTTTASVRVASATDVADSAYTM